MASASAVAMATPQSAGAIRRPLNPASFFNPMPLPARSAVAGISVVSKRRLEVRAAASMKEKVVSGLTAGAVAMAMVIPDAEAAGSGLSPSLKNFLLSISAGGVVLGAIVGAVVAVSNFDPVRRT